MTEVEFVQVTWMRTLKVWWSLLWRGFLSWLLSSAIIGSILVIFMELANAEPEIIKTVCVIVGYVVLIPVGIVVINLVLKTRYSDFKIALIAE